MDLDQPALPLWVISQQLKIVFDLAIYFEGLFRELDHDEDLYARLNPLFDTMPVAVVILDKIICVHGGIPGAVRTSLLL